MAVDRRYAVLGACSVAFAAVAALWRQEWVAGTFAPNLASEFLGALVIVAFIDRAAEARRGADQRRMQVLAMRAFRGPIIDLVDLFASMIKSASPAGSGREAQSVSVIFDEVAAAQLECIDLTASSGWADETWGVHLRWRLRRIEDRFSQPLDRYLAHLDIEFVEDVEDLQGDEYLVDLSQLNAAIPPGQRVALFDFAPKRRRCVERLLKVIAGYESRSGRVIPVPAGAREDVAPARSSARLPESMIEARRTNGQ